MTTVHLATLDDLLPAALAQLGGEPPLTIRRVTDVTALTNEPVPIQDVVVLDEALAQPGTLAHRTLLGRRNLVLICERDVEATVRLFTENSRLCHVLARAGAALPRQLASTLARLTGRAAPGLAGYLAAGTAVTAETLVTTADKQALIDRITAAAAAVAGFSELPAAVATIATELVTNAVFNAPYDFNREKPRYRDRPRHSHLALAPGEEVTVAYGHDDQVFALSVRDNFGTLSRDALLANITRSSLAGDLQIRMKTPGAGVGLYMVLSSAGQFDVHVTPGQRTELVALVALTKRYRDFAQSGHSLNLFTGPQE